MGGAAGQHGREGGAWRGLVGLGRLGLEQLERPAMSEWRNRLSASDFPEGFQPVVSPVADFPEGFQPVTRTEEMLRLQNVFIFK